MFGGVVAAPLVFQLRIQCQSPEGYLQRGGQENGKEDQETRTGQETRKETDPGQGFSKAICIVPCGREPKGLA
jgi:hypothetical protein